MTPKRSTVPNEQAGLAAFRAAGYCGAEHPDGHVTCTRPPGHTGEHVNYYRGRPSPEATEGYWWPK